MAGTTKFQGRFMYYENINGKEKKVFKEFTDPKKFNEFTKKYPMPTLGSMFGLILPSKKALPTKSSKACCGSCGFKAKAKKPAKKK